MFQIYILSTCCILFLWLMHFTDKYVIFFSPGFHCFFWKIFFFSFWKLSFYSHCFISNQLLKASITSTALFCFIYFICIYSPWGGKQLDRTECLTLSLSHLHSTSPTFILILNNLFLANWLTYLLWQCILLKCYYLLKFPSPHKFMSVYKSIITFLWLLLIYLLSEFIVIECSSLSGFL